MRFSPPITALALLLLVVADHVSPQQSPTQPLPIIDMHIHAFGLDQMGNPPPANPRTGKATPTRTDRELMEATLSELKRYNIVKAVAGGPTRRRHAMVSRRPGTDHRRHNIRLQ